MKFLQQSFAEIFYPFAFVPIILELGRATSNHLKKWKQTYVAISGNKNADGTITMIFSGTAVVASFNTSGFGTKKEPSHRSLFTLLILIKHNTCFAKHQNMAYSFNGVNFMQYKKTIT